MRRTASPVIWVLAGITGAVAALAVTWLGDWIGSLLEGTFQITLRAWELAALQVSFVNTLAGAVAGVLGALSKRWLRGLGIGAILHAIVFLIFVLTSDSFRAAPASVNAWVLSVGVIGGGVAGAIGGVFGQVSVNKQRLSDDSTGTGKVLS
ncbi:MAG TPA: hypothetical protein VNK04_13565 [Gemmataceae bacterium]|nr:hypothetical protein [Gemmataceae bacterium]